MEGMVTCNFATFRTVMMGIGSVGKAFSVFERARNFSLLPLMQALKELDETGPWVEIIPAAGPFSVTPTATSHVFPPAAPALPSRLIGSPGGVGSGPINTGFDVDGVGRTPGTPDALAALGEYVDEDDDASKKQGRWRRRRECWRR